MDIKKELIFLIDKEDDLSVLEAIRVLLSKTSLDPELKHRLSNRALHSEQDINEGNLLSREDLEERLKEDMGI